jgi:type I restriction enzyme S subunit
MSWDLPLGWAWARLGDVVTVRGEKIRPDRSNGLPFIGMDDVLPGSLRVNTHGWFREMKSTGNAVEPGDILYGRLRPYLNKVAIADARAAASAEFIVLNARAGIDARYVQFALHARRFVNFATQDTSGDRPRVDFDKISKFEIPVPPTDEQRRIVARIDELFAEIAEGEGALERARQGLDTWRRALLKAAVTGELTRDWREASRSAETGADLLARIRAERQASAPRSGRTRRSAASGALEANSPPVLPDGWAWTTLGECISHLTSGSRDWSQYYDRGSAIFIMAQNIRPGRYNHNYVKHVAPPVGGPETTRTRVHRNDLLVTIVGANTGDVCRVDFDPDNYFVCQSVALVRPILSEMSGFLGLYFVARDGGRGEFEKVIYGAGRPHLSFDQLLETRIPIPSLAEMREIVERVRLEEEAAFSEQEFAGFHRDLLALRQSILKAAFEGRLTPQDPADEPASALLARLSNGFPSNGARRRRARATADFPHPSLPGLTGQSVEPRVERAGEE